jgi:hypothetical protein
MSDKDQDAFGGDLFGSFLDKVEPGSTVAGIIMAYAMRVIPGHLRRAQFGRLRGRLS